MGPSHAMKRCRPPSARIRPEPGRSMRWYVLERRMRVPAALRSAGARPLTVPCVPTGMNAGVGTSPCGVASVPARGPVRPPPAVIVKVLRGPWTSVPGSSGFDPVFLQLRPERLPRDAQPLRRLGLVSLRLLQRLLDRHPLGGGDGHDAGLALDHRLDDGRAP